MKIRGYDSAFNAVHLLTGEPYWCENELVMRLNGAFYENESRQEDKNIKR